MILNDNIEVNISKKLYEKLLDDQRLLNALMAGGVDNWGGYDYALEIYEENKSE